MQSLPDCDFVAWNKPVQEKCPECGGSYRLEKYLKAGPVLQCPNGECKYKREAGPTAVASSILWEARMGRP